MDRPQRASLERYSESDWRESGSSPSVVVVGGDDLPFTRFLNFLVKLGMGIRILMVEEDKAKVCLLLLE